MHLTGCKLSSAPFKKIKSLSITLPYAPEGYNIYIHRDSVYLYTYNYNTYKQLNIYNEQGRQIFEINLKHLFLPYGLQFVSINKHDSIYVLATETNVLYLINYKNEVKKKIRLDSLLKKHLSLTYPFRMYGYTRQQILYRGGLMLRIAHDKPIKESDSIFKNQIQYNQNNISLPSFAYICDVLGNNTKVMVENPTLMSKFMKENEYFPILVNHSVLNDTLYFYATFYGKIVRYNLNELQYTDEIQIHSEHTKLDYTVPVITEANVNKVFQNTGFKISRLGSIVSIGLNSKKNCFYVYVSHQHSQYNDYAEYKEFANTNEKKGSVLVFDKKWKKTAEYMIPDTEKNVFFLEDGSFITQSKTKNPRNITLNFYQWTE